MQKGLARGYCDPFVHLYLENDDQEKLQKLFLSIQEPEIMVTFFLKNIFIIIVKLFLGI